MTAEAAVPTCHCGVTLPEGRRGGSRNFCTACWSTRVRDAAFLRAQGSKLCSECDRILPLSAFYVNKRSDGRRHGGHSAHCRECERSASRAWYAAQVKACDAYLVAEKTCRGCRRTQPASEFGRNPRTHDKLHMFCKPCTRRGRYVGGSFRVAVVRTEEPAVIAPLEWDYDLICLACSARTPVKWTEQRARLEVVASRFRCGACRGFVLIERADLAIGGTSGVRVHSSDSHAWRVVPTGPGRSEVKPYEQGESWW